MQMRCYGNMLRCRKVKKWGNFEKILRNNTKSYFIENYADM